MSYRFIDKQDFPSFIESLSKEYEVAGPVRREGNQHSFEILSDFSRLVLDYVHTLLPPKKFFLPQQETLLRFESSAAGTQVTVEPAARSLAIVGIHPCDLHGIQRLDSVFGDENPDPYYLAKRKESLLIGVNCQPDEQCFCASMGTMKPPAAGFDLFLTDTGTGYAVETGTAAGQAVLDQHAITRAIDAGDIARIDGWYEKKAAGQVLSVKSQVEHLPLLFEGEYRDKIWDELGQRCLSCGACNLVCPTCYCFDIKDDVELSDLQSGIRQRFWDGCQLEDFARVAGGENFRHHRKDRNRHRFYRKFLYPVLKYKKTFCVACGRCVRNCLVHICVVETVNHFVEKSLRGGAR